MPQRLRQILLVGSLLWLSWLAMMLVHESGHMIGALCTGGSVRRIVWFPTALSRTDVSPNPHPLVETWAGPVLGCLLPVLFAWVMVAIRLQAAYLFLFFAGFCLIANGAYIGLGAAWPVGDAKVLLGHGTSRFALAAFGALTVLPGFLIWNRISPRLGFGRSPVPIRATHVWITLIIAAMVTAICWAAGLNGG